MNPSQLCKRTALLRDGYVGRDPRRSRTARGVTALTRISVAHVKLNRTHLRQLSRERSIKTGWGRTPSTNQSHLVGPPSTHLWPARLYARAAIQFSSRPHPDRGHQTRRPQYASLLTLKGVRARRSAQWRPLSTAITASGNIRPHATAPDTMT